MSRPGVKREPRGASSGSAPESARARWSAVHSTAEPHYTPHRDAGDADVGTTEATVTGPYLLDV